jgi:hypothetical protein
MDLLPGQRRLVKSESRIVAFVGGFGSGKTRGAVYKSLVLGFKNAPCVGIFVEPTYTMVRDVAVRSFEEILREMGLPYHWHRTDHIMRIADTFDILFRSGDQPERMVGINAAWGVIDEPAIQSEEVPKTILSRLRDPRAKLYQLALTGTPEGFNWFYEWCHRPDTDLIRAKTTDNPFLPPSYVEELKKKFTQEEVNAYINGEFVKFEGGWYHVRPAIRPCEMEGDIRIFKRKHQTSGQLLLGIDTAGGIDRDASAIALIDKRDKSLVATWVDASATVDKIRDVASKLYTDYTFEKEHIYKPYTREEIPMRPHILVEMNGIGRATHQALTAIGVPCSQVHTKEDTRYSGLLKAKLAVECGIIDGPLELAKEADLLCVVDGKFEGPKDLSMAIGFCLNELEKSPYIPPATNRDRSKINFEDVLKKRSAW